MTATNVRARGQHENARATRREALTEKRIQALAVPEKATSIYDSKIQALGLRLSPKGKRTFFWFRAVNGKPKWVTIGEWPDIRLDTPNGARAKAQELNIQLANWQKDGGANPFDKPRDDTAPLTLSRLVELYIDKKRMSEKAARELRATISRYLADWTDKRLDAITHSMIADRHSDLGKGIGLTKKRKRAGDQGETTANHTIAVLGCMYRWAIKNERWDGKNPAWLPSAKDGGWFKENKRVRCLDGVELERLFAVCAEYRKRGSPQEKRDLADFTLLSLATAQRKKTVMRMRWETSPESGGVSMRHETWKLLENETKNREVFVCPLTPEAMTILEGRRGNGSPYVFPSPLDPQKPRFDFNGIAWKKFLKLAALDYPRNDPRNFRGHDLRHTAISMMVMASESLEAAGAAVGHKSITSTQRYSHFLPEAKRDTALAGARYMRLMMEKAEKAPKQKQLTA